jgi:hypothetical protein
MAHPPERANHGGDEDNDLTNYSPESRAILTAYASDFHDVEVPFVEQTEAKPEPVVTDKPKGNIPGFVIGNDSDQTVTDNSTPLRRHLTTRNVTDDSTANISDLTIGNGLDSQVVTDSGSVTDKPSRKNPDLINRNVGDRILQATIRNRYDEIGVHGGQMNPHCNLCGRILEPNEPVFRCKVRNRYGGFDHTVACQSCVGTKLSADGVYRGNNKWAMEEYGRPVLCRHCGRQIFSEWRRKPIRHYCSRDCENAAASLRGKLHRVNIRGIRCCPECGQDFWPKRTDSLYCSSACKQRAYRKRVTGDEAKEVAK